MKVIQAVSRIMGFAGVILLSAAAWSADVAEPHKTPVIAPAFGLQNQDGKKVQLSDFAGKIVVLEWVNYDCPFVKAEYKAGVMKNLAEKYAKKGVVWLAVNSTNYADVKGNEAFIKEYQLSYPVLLDKDGKVGKLYKATNTPHIFIVDAKGVIAYQGAVDNAPLAKKPEKEAYVNYAEKALDELIAGKSVSRTETKPYGCSVKYAEPDKPKPQAKAVGSKTRRSSAGNGYRPGY
jgi:peroxiredoxin